jgi:hypothetical protein
MGQLQTYVDEAVARRLRPDQTPAPACALASQDALPLVPLGAIGTKKPADLASGDANIARRNIRVSADVPAQLAHKGHTELPDLVVGLALRIEVGAALTTSNINWISLASSPLSQPRSGSHVPRNSQVLTSRQCILEDLLKAQELQD